jgi:alkylated DNA repair dioxygenase AlkB
VFSKPLFVIRPGLCLCIVRHWLVEQTQLQLMAALEEKLHWTQGSIRIFGREIAEPRLTAWCGDVGYTYSRRQLAPKPWPSDLDDLREQLHTTIDRFGVTTAFGFNHCLLNFYRSGDDSMGWHRDNEIELGDQPVIASVSLGDARRFRLRSRQHPKFSPITFELGHGDLLLMYGMTQHHWKHSLLKTRQTTGPRMNLTFRSVGQR